MQWRLCCAAAASFRQVFLLVSAEAEAEVAQEAMQEPAVVEKTRRGTDYRNRYGSGFCHHN